MNNIDYEELYFNPPIVEWVNGKMKIIHKKRIETKTYEPKQPKNKNNSKKNQKEKDKKYISKDTNNTVYF